MSAKAELEVLTAVIDALGVASSAAFELGDDAWPLRRSIVSTVRDAINRKAQLIKEQEEI